MMLNSVCGCHKMDAYLIDHKMYAIVSILLCVHTAAVVILINARVVSQKQVLESHSVLFFERNHQLVTQTKKDELYINEKRKKERDRFCHT